MSFLRSSSDIVNAVLRKSGELESSSSPFYTAALEYIDQVHKGIIAGGNEFDIDIADAWLWAKSPRDIIINLVPPVTTGTVTLTLGSTAGTFSSAPTVSQKGNYLKIEARDEYFRIVSHTAATTSFTLDKAYTEASGTFNFKSIQLEYDVVDDTIIIDSTNNKLDFTADAAVAYTATLTSASYSPTAFATEVETQMDALATADVAVSWNANTRKFTISSATSTTFSLRFATGTNALISCAAVLGFNDVDQTAATSYTSEYSLNAISRFIQPFVMYRKSDNLWSSREEDGKVFAISENDLLRKHPLSELRNGIPTRFAETYRSPNGIVRVRFNKFVDNISRVEVPYIPVPRTLQNNTISRPLVPEEYCSLLVFGASYYIMLDKSDDKAQTNFSLAAQKLKSLQKANRKGIALAGKYWGELIPRAGQVDRFKRYFST